MIPQGYPRIGSPRMENKRVWRPRVENGRVWRPRMENESVETWRAEQECRVQKGITELHRPLDSLGRRATNIPGTRGTPAMGRTSVGSCALGTSGSNRSDGLWTRSGEIHRAVRKWGNNGSWRSYIRPQSADSSTRRLLGVIRSVKIPK